MSNVKLSSVVVYHYPLSRSLRVIWLLNELGIEFEARHVKILKGEAFTPEYLKMNPNHAVPVLQYKTPDGLTNTVIESSAIVRFIALYANQFPREGSLITPLPSLIPSPATHSVQEVAAFEQWFAFTTVTLDMNLWGIRVFNDFLGGEGSSKEAMKVYVDKWNNELLPQLNKRFEENPQRQYAMDWDFSLVDIVLGQVLNWSRKYRFLKPFGPKLREYHKRLSSRPAFQKSVKDGALFEKEGSPRELFAKYLSGDVRANL